jgi:hypothetical protein
MKRWALIVNSVVSMVVEQDTQPQIAGVWVECPDYVGPGWVYADGRFSPPPPPEETAAE